jgi:plasmid stabilization system protein ParE
VKRISFAPAAEAELADAVAFYDQQRAGVGSNLTESIEAACEFIAEHPLAGEPYYHRTRRKRLLAYDYYVIYEIRRDVIRVVAIAHESRRPNYWRDRVR